MSFRKPSCWDLGRPEGSGSARAFRSGVSEVQAAFVTSLVTVNTKRLNIISRAVRF